VTNDEDIETRRERALRIARGQAGTAGLAALLADEDWRVRKQAAEAASVHLAEAEVRAVLVAGLLQSEDVGLRNASVEAFVRADPSLAPVVAAALVEALAGATPSARKFVCAALVGGGRDAVEPLAGLADEDDVMTACAAVEALVALARRGIARPAIGRLLGEALVRPEPVLRLAALDGLGASGVVIEADALRGALEDPVTSAAAIAVLGQARGTGISELLLAALPRPHTAVEAAVALVRRGDLAAETTRSRALEATRGLPSEARARLVAAVRAREVEDARSVAQLLLEAGAAADAREVIGAVVALGVRAELDPACRAALLGWGESAVAILLELALEAPEDDVGAASWALEAAADIASLGVSAPLVARLAEVARALLARGEEAAAKAGARALARFGEGSDAVAITALADTLGSSFEPVAAEAVAAIAERSGEGPLASRRPLRRSRPVVVAQDRATLRRDLASDDPLARAGALDALESLDGPDTVELVAMALADEDEEVQLAALRALSRTRGAEARVEAARSARVLVDGASSPVRAEALRTLSLLGGFDRDDRREALLAHLADPSPQVVIAALRVVGVSDLAGPGVEAALEHALAHVDPEVVKETLQVMARRRDPAARARLVACLAHPHWSVRTRAAELLGDAAGVDPAARSALEARAAVETDELVLRAIGAALAAGGPDA
jgi:hypothetical protein